MDEVSFVGFVKTDLGEDPHSIFFTERQGNRPPDQCVGFIEYFRVDVPVDDPGRERHTCRVGHV